MPNTRSNPPGPPPASDRQWWESLPVPLTWYGAPSDHTGYIMLDTTRFQESWQTLVAWCRTTGSSVLFYSFQDVMLPELPRANSLTESGALPPAPSAIRFRSSVRVPNRVMVTGGPDGPMMTAEYVRNGYRQASFDAAVCPSCDTVLRLGDLSCSSCLVTQTCSSCGEWHGPLFATENGQLCDACSDSCDECGLRSEFRLCVDHADGERFNCVNCGSYTDDGSGAEFSDYWGGVVCSTCIPEYCAGCERQATELDRNGFCYDCADREASRQAQADHGTEEFEEEDKTIDDLFVASIPGRENIRMCGLEIEGAGNYRGLANSLAESGLTRHTSINGYHTATTERESTYWSLERDSSVDWELVSPPINLANREHIGALRQTLNIVRQEIKSGAINFDMRCGLHIHVGAERTAIGGAFNLGTVWGYLEDVIFRLGAARWPKHRAIVNGVHYCRPTLKGAKTRLEFGLQIENQDEARYGALSFNNYIRAMSRGCQCGAVRYDSWDQCVCDLGKCTFEFRVFNTSANMHKIHAYLALCQSLVAYATNLPDLDVSAFPAQEFIPQMVEGMGSRPRTTTLENWKPRLEFLFNELPLTDPEKADLLYCVRSSELSLLGEEFIGTLAPNNAQEVLI